MQFYPYLFATHIIFIITWFAALFYIVRLFIYHTEALQKNEPERSILAEQFTIMEKRLMHIIGTPSMVLAIGTGIGLVSQHTAFLQEGWFHVKLTFVICVIVYHFICLRLIGKLEKRTATSSSKQLRLFNELATVLLVGIVFLVVLKNMLNMLYGLLGLILLSVVLMIAVKLYRRSREKNA